MKIRRYRPEDADKIDDIYRKCHGHFNLPTIKHCLEIAVVEDDNGNVIGLGAFQLIPEVMLILDNEKPKKREQVKALKMLLEAGETVANLYDFHEFYAFPDSNKYGELLKKHFKFRDCDPILIKRLNDGE